MSDNQACREMTPAEKELAKATNPKVLALFIRKAGKNYELFADKALELHKASGKSKERAMADVLTEKNFKNLYHPDGT